MRHLSLNALLALCAALTLVPAIAAEGKSHVHGTGTLDIAINKEQVNISLELPLDVVVGFERAPKTEKEKAALIEASMMLNAASSLFILNPEAKCTGQATNIVLPSLGVAKGSGKQPEAKAEEHADIEAAYTFRCENPAALKRIETSLFKQFKRLYRLEAQRAGPEGQGLARLTPKQPFLQW